MTTAREHGVEATRPTERHDACRPPDRVLDTELEARGQRVNETRPELVRVRMIGPLTVVRPDGERSGRTIGAVKTRALLELLLLSRGRPLSKDELVHALWGEGRNVPSEPFRALEHYVCVLRSALTADRAFSRALLVTGTNSYVLDPELIDVDVDRMEHLLHLAAGAGPDMRRRFLEQAVAMATDDLLADSPSPSLAQRHREAHREVVAGSHLWLADAALSHGELHRVVWHSEAALRFTPFSEHAYRLLIVAHHVLGDTGLARLTMRRCCTALRRGLSIDPTSLTLEVAARVQAGATRDELVALLRSNQPV